jgi:hypothetical protein
MTPNLELMLATLERALATSILPGTADAAAKEEASLAILFTRWIREVLDHMPGAERASYRDCRAALDDVTARIERHVSSGAALGCLREWRIPRLDPDEASPAELRQATREIRMLLGRLLRALRADGHGAFATEVRARLYDLGVHEIERERAFGRASTMDADSTSIPSLADLARGDQTRRQTK